jgi:DNA-binding response OmpR family regulator
MQQELAPPPRAGRALILVVEQDPQMRRLERYFLEQAGFTVEFAADGYQGLETARRLRPDIVVAEILVTGLDGLSVCRALKADPATRAIVVLIFSILAAEQRARDAGADGFVRKPLDDAHLVESIEALLRQHRKEGASDATA